MHGAGRRGGGGGGGGQRDDLDGAVVAVAGEVVVRAGVLGREAYPPSEPSSLRRRPRRSRRERGGHGRAGPRREAVGVVGGVMAAGGAGGERRRSRLRRGAGSGGGEARGRWEDEAAGWSSSGMEDIEARTIAALPGLEGRGGGPLASDCASAPWSVVCVAVSVMVPVDSAEARQLLRRLAPLGGSSPSRRNAPNSGLEGAGAKWKLSRLAFLRVPASRTASPSRSSARNPYGSGSARSGTPKTCPSAMSQSLGAASTGIRAGSTSVSPCAALSVARSGSVSAGGAADTRTPRSTSAAPAARAAP